MPLKGVCTSPNGVAGCKSPTCPGSSFTANLESFKFYKDNFFETKKYGSRDEWDSLEMNLTIAVDSMLEDYMLLDGKSREQIRASLTPEDIELMSEYNEGLDTAEIFDVTSSFASDDLDSIENGYIEAALWTDAESVEGKNVDDVDFQSHLQANQEIYKFIHENKDAVKEALKVYPAANIGHDLWLTRNGHGAGFWDREELKANGLGDKLTEGAKKFREVSPVIADDGKVIFE